MSCHVLEFKKNNCHVMSCLRILKKLILSQSQFAMLITLHI